MSNAKGKTESRTPSPTPLAILARARTMRITADLARTFATLRPLALLRATRLFGSLATRWSLRPTIMRPWPAALTHQPWLGRVPRFAYRLRRPKLESEAERAPAWSVRTSPPDAWPYLAGTEDVFEAGVEAASPLAVATAEAAEATPSWPWLALEGAIQPLGVPRELTISRRFAAATTPAADESNRRVLAAHRPTAAGIPALIQRSAALSSPLPVLQPSAAIPQLEATSSTAQQKPAIGAAVGDGGVNALPLPEPMLRAAPAAARSPSPPAWPFRLLKPEALTLAAADVTQTPAFRAPLVMRMAQRMRVTQPLLAAHAPLAAMTRLPSAESMLTHVVLPATAGVSATQRVVRESRLPGRAQTLQPGPTRFDRAPAPVVRDAAHAAEPLSGHEPSATPMPDVPAHESHVTREFPVLRWLRAAAPTGQTDPVVQDAPAAMQVLRRFSAPQLQRARMGLAAPPSFGQGEALPAGVRQPLETILQRNLSNVRTHTSPLAETLGAVAFTTGERIVFAPGRMDVRSARGLALLAHELTHVGQPLAFKQSADSGATDSAEQRAQTQESEVEHMIEQGWPQAPRMEVRQAAQALGALARGESPAERTGSNLQFEQRALDSAVSPPAAETLPAARLSEAPPAGSAVAQGGAPPDVDKLAREVYDILKARLRTEKIRHQVY